ALAAAETCYRDNDGRIVKRRRPGYVEVECPAPGEAKPQSNAAPGTVRESPDAVPGAPTPFAQREPAKVSPVPRPGLADYTDAVPMPDRWRIVDALLYQDRWWDPYNRNVLKGDKPVHGDDWFFNLSVVSDSVYELRDVPTGVGAISTNSPGQIDVFGSSDQWAFVENLATEFVYYKGDTVFKPPEWEFRFTPVFNFNRTVLDEVQGVNADPRE